MPITIGIGIAAIMASTVRLPFRKNTPNTQDAS